MNLANERHILSSEPVLIADLDYAYGAVAAYLELEGKYGIADVLAYDGTIDADEIANASAALKKLEGFRLDGIVQKMKCPFLLLHGAGDEQIPLPLAEKLYAAVGSAQKELKVFSREEGGFHHCQVDNVTIGTNFMWDWAADVLKPGT